MSASHPHPQAGQDLRPSEDRVPLLQVHDLQIRSAAGTELVQGMQLTVMPGEAVAIVGESGSGKSLTSRAIIDLLPDGLRSTGTLTLRGRDIGSLPGPERARLRGRDVALVLQDPFTMLNPLERCGRQIVEPLRDPRGRRLSARAGTDQAQRRLAEVGIADPSVANRFPFELSGGMRQRVAIAAALAQEPRLLIADEPTTALDATTQADILQLLQQLRLNRGMGLVLITHDLRVAFSTCDRVYVMYAGGLLEAASSRDLQDAPTHPYTLGLLLAEPPGDRRVAQLRGIPGSVPAPGQRPGGCTFAPRCTWRLPSCENPTTPLPLLDVSDEQLTRCARVDEIKGELHTSARGAQVPAAPATTITAPAGSALLMVQGLAKQFRGRSRKSGGTTALAGVDLQVAEGESVGLVGQSGSGKTTLGRIVLGLESPSAGVVRVAGRPVAPVTGARAADRRARRDVQMVFQDPYSSLNPARTIGATLGEALTVAATQAEVPRSRRVGELLELVGLPASYAGNRPSALSGGERQRAAIARALAISPRLLVCDEVVSALDVSVQAQILTLLRALQEELRMALLFITHDLAVVRQVTDRLYVMHAGSVVETGPTEQVLQQPQHPYTRTLLASVPQPAHKPAGGSVQAVASGQQHPVR